MKKGIEWMVLIVMPFALLASASAIQDQVAFKIGA
jgi:hypothetical protein